MMDWPRPIRRGKWPACTGLHAKGTGDAFLRASRRPDDQSEGFGNAFRSQQAEVMDAVQRMRLKAQQAGKLSSTAQQTVTTANDSGQPVIVIEPSNPQVIRPTAAAAGA
jgi:hypothetical protein